MQLAAECKSLAASTTAKIGHAPIMSALAPIATTLNAARTRSERAASTRAPPGIWPAKATKTAGGQHEPDIALGPFLRGQINGHQGAEAHLRVCKEEDEPIESAQTTAGGGRKMTPRRGL